MRGIAYLDSAPPWTVYAEGFRRAANRLVEEYESGRLAPSAEVLGSAAESAAPMAFLSPGFTAYPVLYLYRHSIELSLKAVLEKAERRLLRPVKVAMSHRMDELWRDVRTVIEEAWPDGDAALLDRLETAILEFHSDDPKGETYRYPLSGDGSPTISQSTLVDLIRVRAVVDEIAILLDGAAETMAYEADLRDEIEGYYQDAWGYHG